MTTNSDAIQNRYDFLMLFDVENGNPNGDPDLGNLPRVDPETGHGLVTDVSIKRHVRDFVCLVKGDSPGYRIYVAPEVPLNDYHAEAYRAVGLEPGKKYGTKDVDQARAWLCQNFYDIRTFGAVLSTGDNCGQVRGPLQISMARSIDPIFQQNLTITRVTATRSEDEKTRDMGRKQMVPYALFKCEGHISARLANEPGRGTGFSEKDLELFWKAVMEMWDHLHSSSRGKVVTRRLYVFRHDSDLGNAPSHKLFELVTAARKPSVAVGRSFTDYDVVFDNSRVPAGVTAIEMVDG